MIHCTVNGQIAVPSSTNKIKVTYANQYIEDSGSYTYDITYPMSIHANQVIFGNVHRFDVHKPTTAFDDCKLFADNRLFVSGKGTVTSVSESAVKLQIVGGKSRIKYNSKFEKHYIDEIDYPDVKITSGIDAMRYNQMGVTSVDCSTKPSMVLVDLTNGVNVGQPGVALFYPIYDETHDCMSNYYILNTEGYNVIRNDYDCAPWQRLYIASARRSCLIKHALPHWSVYTFIEEFRKLFNASFVFDDVAMTVSIIATNELTNNEAVSYDCLDEYSAEYDEDGLSNLTTSNVEYDFDDSTERDWREFIPLSVLKQYPVLTYDNADAMTNAASAMTVKERRSTIFKVGYTYYIWAMLPKDGNPDSKDETEQRTLCGLFNPIMRDKESDNVVDLKMIPVAMSQRKRIHSKMLLPFTDRIPNKIVCMPSMSNDKDTSLDNMTVDDDGEYYVSVQDAMQGADISSNEEDADEKIRLMFSGDMVRDLKNGQVVRGGTFGNDTGYARYPICLTDRRMYPKLTGVSEDVSLSLEQMPYNNNVNVEIDTHNLYCVKFVTDDIPDPSKIYIFHNRRFVCQKIEMDVSNDGIAKLKTGYFYEML